MIEREHVEFVCPDQLETRPLRLSLGEAHGKVYVGDAEDGNGAVRLELPAGWRGGGETTPHAFEIVILDGGLELDGEPLPQYSYLSVAAGDRIPALSTSGDTVLFVDYIADVTETKVLPWDEEGFGASQTPGPQVAPGLLHKMARGTPQTARAFYLRIPKGWREDRTEWHDCAEASIRLEGSVWSVRANEGKGGTMTRHCYFWRPPRKLHSPMGSETGAFSFTTVDSILVSHFVEEEGLPPEE